MDKSKALAAALSQIERQFGKGSVMKLGKNDRSMDIETVSTGSLGLDIALGVGGLPRGRIVEIYGPESSGKTTFLNALLAEVPREERLILIEDSPELNCPHDNMVGLLAARGALGEAAVSAEDLLIASLRMRPDRIILGEIRGVEAGTFLRAVNTGHPGSLTTIHADSPLRAIDQLALLVLQTGIQMRWEDVVGYVCRSLDVIVQLSRGPQGRTVSTIMQLERNV